VSARILQVSVNKDNQMEVPKTAYDVAWYNGSSRPGENGSMVIDGHVQGVGGPAIFSDLKKLAVGDAIEVTRGDGKKFSYTVSKTETIPVDQVDMGKLLVSADTNKPGLNLITCAGDYDKSSDAFNSRTIVYAVQN
jgi:LPXTG-site transpeptidase (sortase) family protein